MNHWTKETPEVKELKKTETLTKQELKRKEKAFEENIKVHPKLILSIALTLGLLLFVGLGLDLYFLNKKMNGKPILENTAPAVAVGWGLKDVFQLYIFLFFMEAVIVFLEMIAASFVDMKSWNRDAILMANSLLRNLGVTFLVLYWLKRRFRASWEAVGLTAANFWKNIKRGVVGYVAIVPLLFGMLLVMSLTAQLFSYEPEPQAVVQIYLKNSSDKYLLYFTLFVAFAGPVIEEIFFRGFTYTAFRDRFGVRWAMVGSAAIFAALHMNLVVFLPIFLLGIFLAYLYEKTGSLIPSMMVHVMHNLLMVCAALFFKGMAS